MKQLTQNEFKKGNATYKNIASPEQDQDHEQIMFMAVDEFGNLQYSQDGTNYETIQSDASVRPLKSLTPITDASELPEGQAGDSYAVLTNGNLPLMYYVYTTEWEERGVFVDNTLVYYNNLIYIYNSSINGYFAKTSYTKTSELDNDAQFVNSTQLQNVQDQVTQNATNIGNIQSNYVTTNTAQDITAVKTIKDTDLTFANTNASGSASWQIAEDQYGQLTLTRTYNNIPSKMVEFNGNSIKPVGSNGNLGSSSQKWTDLYLSGNLNDGTNTANVANIASAITQTSTNTNDIANLQTAVSGKQDALSETQLSAVNSGIDSTKVGQIATNTSDISNLQTAVAGKQDALTAGSNIDITSNVISATDVVTTNTQQDITAQKTIKNKLEFVQSSSGGGTNKLYIYNDNGYNAKVKMGSTENLRIMTGGTYFGATAAPISDNATDLGASSTAWKDVYLKGTLNFGDSATITKDSSNRINLNYGDNAKVKVGSAETIIANRIGADSDNSQDIGRSTVRWKDLYLAGNLTDGTNSVTASSLATAVSQAALVSSKQDATDNTLTTTNKTIVGAINELDGEVGTNTSAISTINGKIPTEASSSNQLADKDFVNSSINALAAYYITKNANGDPFATKAELNSATTYYSGGSVRVPTTNDYCIVLADESQQSSTGTDPTTRYTYQVNQWEFQYKINDTPLTAAQLSALNSGITSTLVGQIGTNQSDISSLSSNKADKSATVSTVTYDGTNKKLTKTINGTTTDIVTTATLKTDMGLATVATSGSYDDLTNKPTIDNNNQKVKTSSVTFGDNVSVEIKAGSNVTITGDNTANTITIDATDTTYSNLSASQGGTDVSLVTTGEKYTWNNKQSALPTTSTAGKVLKSTSTAGTVEWDDLPTSTPTTVKINGTSITSNSVADIQTNGTYNETTNKIATMSDLPTSINGMSGGTLTSPLNLSGGSENTASKIAVGTDGRITDSGNSTIFGRSGTNGVDLLVGQANYNLKLRGSGTRPKYNGNDLALYSDLPDLSTKMDTANPTGTGSFSLNRKANTTIGDYSVATGRNCTASGSYSFAEGGGSIASGNTSHAEGVETTASGIASHAEGQQTTASGDNSHAEGYNTIAQRQSQHVFGEYNIADTGGSDAHTRGDYVEIVGNGVWYAKANARTLDWSGNEWLAGSQTAVGGYKIGSSNSTIASVSGTALTLGNSSLSVNIAGSGTRPTYNSNSLALYNDVPTTTSSVTQDSTSALTSGGAYTALSGKLDKVTSTTTYPQFYAKKSDGTQLMQDAVSTNQIGSTVMLRNASGQTYVGDPTESYHAASKNYVDTNFATKTLSNVTYPANTIGSTTTGSGDRIIQTYISSDTNSWYRIWASGWKECGGRGSIGENSSTTKALGVTFTSTSTMYCLVSNASGKTSTNAEGVITALPNSSSVLKITAGYLDPNTSSFHYYVCGW